jgi:uncharacterized iron-regulated membrane protein
VAVLILALTFAIPGGDQLSRPVILLATLVLALLAGLALAAVVVFWRRPPGRR